MDSTKHYCSGPQCRGQKCIELSTAPRGMVLTILPNRHEIHVTVALPNQPKKDDDLPMTTSAQRRQARDIGMV